MRHRPINLVLIKRITTQEPSVFDDTVHSVAYLLRLAGFETYISCNTVDPHALNIIWGAHAHFSPPLDQILEVAKPEYSVIFNMEQIAYGNSFVTPEYLGFLEQYRVLDYNMRNIEAMRKYVPSIQAHEFPLLPSPQFASDFTPINEVIAERVDVAFWGAPSERRQAALSAIAGASRSTRWITSAYGHYLSSQIHNVGLCVNIHALETGVFELARCLRPLAMGLPVISETSHLPKSVDWSQSGIQFCDYEEIPHYCEELLLNPSLASWQVRKTLRFMHRPEWPELARRVLLALEQ